MPNDNTDQAIYGFAKPILDTSNPASLLARIVKLESENAELRIELGLLRASETLNTLVMDAMFGKAPKALPVAHEDDAGR